MDLHTLLRGALPTFAGNMTEPAGNMSSGGGGRGMHDGILESLMPLLGGRFNPLMQTFMLVYNVAGSRLGFDPTVILTALGFVWAGNKLWRQVYLAVYGVLQEYLTASIHISSSDEMYLHMMKWLAGQPNMFNSRSLTAETTSRTAWEEEEEAEVQATRISADGDGVYLNFSNQEAKSVSFTLSQRDPPRVKGKKKVINDSYSLCSLLDLSPQSGRIISGSRVGISGCTGSRNPCTTRATEAATCPSSRTRRSWSSRATAVHRVCTASIMVIV